MKGTGHCKLVDEGNKKGRQLDGESRLFKKEQHFVLAGEASIQENSFGNNKEIYHLGSRNPAVPPDIVETRLLSNKVLQGDGMSIDLILINTCCCFCDRKLVLNIN